MRILIVTKHRAPESRSFVLHKSCSGEVNQLSNKGKSAECNSGLYGLRTVFISIEVRKKSDEGFPLSE